MISYRTISYLLLLILFSSIIFVHPKNSSIDPEIPPPPKIEQKINLLFAGDIMMDRGVRRSVDKNFEGDYEKIFENWPVQFKPDIFFANLEGPASNEGTKKGSIYSFRMDPIIIDTLKKIGINILSFSNNHVGDYGQESFVDTMNRLQEAGILFSGAGLNDAKASEVKIIEKNGIKIGFLAFSDVGPEWMKATETRPGSLMANHPRYEEIINTASRLVDYLVVSFHWGEEYKTIHNARQEKLAHSAVENGAKIIIGHHPHVPQDTEVYKNAYIAYSLGNFIFDQSWSEPTMEGMLLEITIEENGQALVKKYNHKLNGFFQIKEVLDAGEEIVNFSPILQ